MKVLGIFLAIAAFLAVTFAAPSPLLNTLNSETGDFGGLTYPLREEIESFTEVDANGDLIAYGFYLPTLSRLGIDNPQPTDPPLGAAIRFDTSSLPMPEQLPFKFVLLNFNPGGHPPTIWEVPHFDIHLFLETPEFVRSIECTNSTWPPCDLTPYMASLFNSPPNLDHIPPSYITDPAFDVPAMGAHWFTPAAFAEDFSTTPANLFGVYDSKVVFHEPMVASTIFKSTETTGSKTFAWPSTPAFPVEGRFFSQTTFEFVAASGSVGDRYKVTFSSLVEAPKSTSGTPIFIGEQIFPVSDFYTNTPSSKKDCLINGADIDGGFLVATAENKYCCRSQGTMNGLSCERPTCSGTANLANPSTAFLYKVGSSKCYAKCYERV